MLGDQILFALIALVLAFCIIVFIRASKEPREKTTMQKILDQYSGSVFYPYGFVEALLEYEEELLKARKDGDYLS